VRPWLYAGGMRLWFSHVVTLVSPGLSSVWAALAAVVLALAWIAAALAGGFTRTWEFPHAWESVLVVVTALATFVMVFFLQSAQERNTRAIQLKLDELLRAVEGARHGHLAGLEQKGDDEIEEVEERLERERTGEGTS
jgi:low affinity Fe/Cu permease